MNRILSILLGLSLLGPASGRAETLAWGAPNADACSAELELKTPYQQAIAAIDKANPSYLLRNWFYHPDEVFEKFAADQTEWWTDLSERRVDPKNFDLAKVKAHVLSPENGSQELRAVRLNFDARAKTIFRRLLDNYTRVMREAPQMEVWIVHKPEDREYLTGLIDRKSADLLSRFKLIASDAAEITLWAQDGSKPLEGVNGTLVQNRGVIVKRQSYAETSNALDAGQMASAVLSDLPFEGGNVIVGSRHVFVGADIVNHAMTVHGLSRTETLRAYETQFGLPIVEVGIRDPHAASNILMAPAFHVDLLMAVGRDLRRPDKREVIFMQSPLMMLKEVFGVAGAETMTGNEFIQTFDRILREFVEREQRSARGISHTMLSFITEVAAHQKNIFDEELQMRRMARLLAARGYAIEWLPGFNNGTPEAKRGVVDPPLKIFNYTNVVFSGNLALVPKLGIERLDRAVFKIYERLGYKVVPMDVAELSLRLRGGPRCLSETYRLPN